MVELNHRDRTIKVKIVYYGPPVGGKTTNLQILHRQADARRRGDLISVNSAQDRTILFDLLPLKTPGFRGFGLRLQVLAVPGQPMYAATRRLVLKGADSLVFVANSALDRWEENVQSLKEMTENLLSHHLDPEQMPLVFQYNKRDLPQVLEPEALDRYLNSRHVETVPAIAVRGEGVLETFTAILGATVHDLARRYAVLEVKDGAPARQWAEQAARDLFGTIHLGPEAGLEADAALAEARATGRPVAPLGEGHTVVRVTPAPAGDEASRSGATSAETRAGDLVESYAETSAQLGAALTELREERDQARSRLDDIHHAMVAAQEVLAGAPLEKALAPVLSLMARLAGTEQASFWVPRPAEPPRAAALLALDVDPVLGSPAALRYVMERAARSPKPVLAASADSLDLGHALDGNQRRFSAVLAVPFRTPGGLQGLGAFYYGADTARPGADAIDHLAEIPRALSAALELAATLHTVRAAERALQLALAGSASIRGLEGVVRSIEELRDRLGEMRNRKDAPAWFREEYVQLVPALGSALEDGRSLLAFGRGETRRETVYLDDLLSELRTPEVTVDIEEGADTVSADATLLRVALRAVADEMRARAGSNTAPLAIHAAARAGRVRVSVRVLAAPQPGEAPAPVTAGLGLGLARRIAELHGGGLEDTGVAAGGVVLSLPAA
jgi:signal recognition particle receptor subunit beta